MNYIINLNLNKYQIVINDKLIYLLKVRWTIYFMKHWYLGGIKAKKKKKHRYLPKANFKVKIIIIFERI